MSDAINDAIAAARAAAAAVPAGVLATTANANAAVPAMVTPAAPLSLDSMMAGGLMVDAWLKVNAFGMFVGASKHPFQSIELELDMAQIAYNYAIKYGNPATYSKSYDHVTCAQGGSWADAVMRAQRVDPKAQEYRSADLPFKVLEDLKDAKGEVLIEAGKMLGHGLATTGWRSFSEFVRRLKTDGVNPNSALIKVKLGYEPMKNAKGEWGVPKFLDYSVLEG